MDAHLITRSICLTLHLLLLAVGSSLGFNQVHHPEYWHFRAVATIHYHSIIGHFLRYWNSSKITRYPFPDLRQKMVLLKCRRLHTSPRALLCHLLLCHLLLCRLPLRFREQQQSLGNARRSGRPGGRRLQSAENDGFSMIKKKLEMNEIYVKELSGQNKHCTLSKIGRLCVFSRFRSHAS